MNNSHKLPIVIGDHEESLGCWRKSNLTCGGDHFIRVANALLPDAEYATVVHGDGVSECQKSCLSSCTCIAFVAMPDVLGDGPACLSWGEPYIYDVKTYAKVQGGHDLYLRVGPSKHNG